MARQFAEYVTPPKFKPPFRSNYARLNRMQRAVLERGGLDGLGGWWDDVKSFFGSDSEQVREAKAQLNRILTAMVILREQVHKANVAKRKLNPSMESFANQYRMAVLDLVNDLCQRDSGFRIALPEGVGGSLVTHRCVQVIKGAGGGFDAWRSQLRSINPRSGELGLAWVPIIIVVALVAGGGATFAYYWTGEGRNRTAALLKQAECAEKVTEALLTGKLSAADAQALKAQCDVGAGGGDFGAGLALGALLLGAVLFGPSIAAKVRARSNK